MAKNQAPTDEEVDEFMELHEEHGSIKAVADRVDWSRPTVSKWINRRQEEEADTDMAESGDDDPMSAAPDDEPATEPNGDYTAEDTNGETLKMDGTDPAGQTGSTPDPAEIDFSDIVEDAPPSPNQLLYEEMDADPDLKEKHIKYVQSKEDRHGQYSPSDLVDVLSDLKINNKRSTIERVKSNYAQRVNMELRRDPDITEDERWATLLTKITGDPSYAADAAGVPTVSGNNDVQVPPSGRGRQQANGQGIQPPQPQGSQPQNDHPPRSVMRGGPAPSQQGYQGYTQPPQQGQQAGGQESEALTAALEAVSEVTETVSELKAEVEQMKNDGVEASQQPESNSVADQMEELVELREKMDLLTGSDDGDSDEIAEQVGDVVADLSEKIARLEAKVENGGDDLSGMSAPSPTEKSEMQEIMEMAQVVDDPDLIQTMIEMQTDPEVLEARAKREEIETDAEWKTALAEAASPEVASKVVEGLSNLAAGVSQAQRVNQPQPAQPAQPAQQPQPAQPVQQGQPAQQQVEQVENEQPQTPQPQPSGDESPLRAELKAQTEAESTEETDSPDNAESADAESDPEDVEAVEDDEQEETAAEDDADDEDGEE